MGTRRIATLLVCLGFLAGVALDKLWLAERVPLFSNAILVRPGITLLGAKVLAGFAFGVLTPLLVALLVLALALFPWTHAAYPVARRERFRLMGRISGLILLIPAVDRMVAQGIDRGYAAKLVQYGWETITESLKQGGITLMMDRTMPLVVFNLKTPGNIARVVQGEAVGTKINP